MLRRYCFIFIFAVAIRQAVCQEPTGIRGLLETFLAPSNEKTEVYFILYTNDSSENGVKVSSTDQVSLRKFFNSGNPTRFIIHGWRGKGDIWVNHVIRKNYLARGEYNIFVVDWSSGADTINYISAIKNSREAGRQIASFIDDLNHQHDLDFNTTYLIGHSLGAHVAGFAGKYVKQGKINTIFGLDPALPLFNFDDTKLRLYQDDAAYVEIIHTNAGARGYDRPIGHASFYPNWGSQQPGCNDTRCSHDRCVQLFAESLNDPNNLDADECESYENIKNKSCRYTGKTMKLGGDPSNYHMNQGGVYYLQTNAVSPFAIAKT